MAETKKNNKDKDALLKPIQCPNCSESNIPDSKFCSKCNLDQIKTLFNQASALFVLITGEEFFKAMLKGSETRPVEYTLFSQRIFLQRPLFDKMREFIDKILYEPDKEKIFSDHQYWKYKSIYPIFRNYLCFASRTDFFDVYNVIRDYLDPNQETKDHPRFKIKLEKKMEILAQLQEALEEIYISKRVENQSFWYTNDQLLDKMYNFLTILSERKNDVKFIKIEREKNFDLVFLDRKSHPINEINIGETNETEREALDDLIPYLRDLGFLHQIQKDSYEIIGAFKTSPSDTKPIIKERMDFLEQYNVLQYVVLSYAKIYDKYAEKDSLLHDIFDKVNRPDPDRFEALLNYNKLMEIIFPSRSIFVSNKEKFLSIYKGLTKEKPERYSKDKLEDNTRMIKIAVDEALQNFLHVIKMTIIESKKVNITIQETLPPQRSDIKIPASLPILTVESPQDKAEYRFLLIVLNPPTAFVDQIKLYENQNNDFYSLILFTGEITGDIINKTSLSSKDTPMGRSQQVLDATEPDYYQIKSKIEEQVFNKDKRLITLKIPKENSFEDAFSVINSWILDIQLIKETNADILVAEGLEKAKVKQYDNAIELYNKALARDPKHYQAWNNKGTALNNLGRYDEAVECFEKATQINPNFADAWNNKGTALNNLGRYDEAVE